jgi:cobalamin biosynthesis protein CobD/CbiB
MTLTDLALSQFTDPFRIALLIGLVITMQRTVSVTGKVIPLLAGVAFVAVIIPSTITKGLEADYLTQIGVGVVTNAVMLAVILGIKALIDRRRVG